MATLVQIANRALGMMGEQRIMSLDDDLKAARVLDAAWPIVRDKVLAAHNWNCAMKRGKLAQLASSPVSGWEHEYQLPVDWLRTASVHGSDVSDDYPQVAFREEGRKLLTDAADVYLRYVFRETDATQYDALLVDALAAAWAAETVEEITSLASLGERLQEKYEARLAKAMSVDALRQPMPRRPESPWVTRRHA